MKYSLLMLAAVATVFSASPVSAKAPESPLSYEVTSLSGEKVDLSKYKGKVVMIVNVASRCGATPQYETLQQLHEMYSDKGLVILGFPCNQFGKQEPGTAAQIQEFCTSNYGVTFDMFSKIDVNGDDASPLYKHLTSEEASPEHAGDIRWNFEKFLIGKDGKVVARFRTGVQPNSDQVIATIERELKK
ncbi:glutathione peroxidase [Rubinisphaera margarita]|uniref:glutathione peroxidase n=1 Tax=Rubinisphaera margarita TaxID=2909586 RepID=UPI001EE97E7A|nr:glutathione peroxidase [Rubinisphaera margarita]MCG6156101.1 glutathione peroxidase [Rubinisphaera margarita]